MHDVYLDWSLGFDSAENVCIHVTSVLALIYVSARVVPSFCDRSTEETCTGAAPVLRLRNIRDEMIHL